MIELVKAGSSISVDATKVDIELMKILITEAHRSGARITFKGASVTDPNVTVDLARHGGKCLSFDLT
jgi:hypothetical protein